MKFSYPLIKKLVPALSSKKSCLELLTMHAFEAENVSGDTIDISITPNRYADAASHWGVARELAAILNTKPAIKQTRIINPPRKKTVQAEVQNPEKCPRYAAYRIGISARGTTPKWMKDTLRACGLRPIHYIVDITNYVMLETGQPLHAFDADKVAKESIIVRDARNGEKITAIDGNAFTLTKDDLVIADKEKPLAIAGIKGGVGSEISEHTKEIILEAANFDPVTIFHTSRRLRLTTDASVRFSHGLSPELVSDGIERATRLFMELANGVLIDTVDVYPKKQGRVIVGFRLDEHNKKIGSSLSKKEAMALLSRLGFAASARRAPDEIRVEVPPLRRDIAIQEDISEEIARLQGYENIAPRMPVVSIQPAEVQEQIMFNGKIRHILVALGFDEVYTHSLIPHQEKSRELLELENPLSEQFWHLRPSLEIPLRDAVAENKKHNAAVRLFELGRVFGRRGAAHVETQHLGVALYSDDIYNAIEMKGVFEELFRRTGLVSFFFREDDGALRIESDHHVLGTIATKTAKEGTLSYGEIDVDALLRLVQEEGGYEPLSRFPSIMRDISFIIDANVRIGPIIAAVQELGIHKIADVDLLDMYQDEAIGDNRKSIALRVVFQSQDRTLTDKEVDVEMEKIVRLIEERWDAEVR